MNKVYFSENATIENDILIVDTDNFDLKNVDEITTRIDHETNFVECCFKYKKNNIMLTVVNHAFLKNLKKYFQEGK